jgi:hypothetical protein
MVNLMPNKSVNSRYNYRFVNNSTGWIVFIIASFTYLSTIEPTTSYWDCGEFIASAHKLEVGHPPGAPLFAIIAKVFSLLAGGDLTKVALMVNAMSALASSFTILLLFWTITYFAQKLVNKQEKDYTLAELIAIMGSGVVGALAYTFSDTFWFSAVEGEVYALSSLFTALVFWAILKWERISDQKYANRWLILIAYLMGLSIGVHLLNLLAIPAIVFVYYFKKYKTSYSGIFGALGISVLILGAVMYGIIPGFVKIASWFELAFVNQFGLPLNSGLLFYIIFIVIVATFGIYFCQKKKYVIANTIIVSVFVMLLGYSSYTMIVIRASANTPMNENNPSNVFSLLSYLNREQYGNRPLLYGQYFNAEIIETVIDSTYTPKDGKYVKIPVDNPTYRYDSAYYTIFPRMYSRNKSHISSYQSWAGISDISKKPSFIENLVFFFGYQVNHMYIRYFMWNFAGRQNDLQGNGGILKGNWISGIPAFDAIRLGSQKGIPPSMESNVGNNKYYMLPFLLGILGFMFSFQRKPKQFIVIFLLFILTGLAIVVYLNQTPSQPRERDYAYAGSFYAFAIWIGLGVLALITSLDKIKKTTMVSISVFVVTLALVPGIMAKENWDDHDRSGRYIARDLAKNYLNTCAPNAILFTYGDNDTFPLWYVQEVEGYRTDVRVVNLSLLSTDWYIDQMKTKVYNSSPVPFSLSSDKYEQGVRDAIYVSDKYEEEITLKKAMDFVASDDPKTRLYTQDGDIWDYLPGKKFSIPVDKSKIIKTNQVKPELQNNIVDTVHIKISGNYVYKGSMMTLDLLANFNWDRPLYFAVSIGDENFMNLQEYFRLEGFAYRLVPLKSSLKDGLPGYIDTDLLYENLMNKFVWGRMDEPDVLIDNNIQRNFSFLGLREIFYRLANELIIEGKNAKAAKVLDKIVELMPNNKVIFDSNMLPIIEAYYRIRQSEKANKIVETMFTTYSVNVNYYLSFTGINAHYTTHDTKNAVTLLEKLVLLTDKYGQKHLYEKFSAAYDRMMQKYMTSVQSK